MRRLSKIVLTLGVAVFLAMPATAQQRQQRQRGRGGFGGPAIVRLVQNEGVQKELNLDKEQIDKAKEAIQQVQDKHKDDFAKLQELSREEQREKRQALNTTVSEEATKALEGVLKPEQMKRLKQIELQQRGADALTDPKVQKKLKLTDDQKDKIKTITEDAAKERPRFQPGGDFEELQKKIATLRKETMEKVSAVLNDDQKKAWKDMIGQPFEVRFERRRNP